MVPSELILVCRLSSSLKFPEADLAKESFSVLAIKLPSLSSKVAGQIGPFFCGEGLSSDSADPYAIEGIKSDPAATALSPSSCLPVMRSVCSISTPFKGVFMRTHRDIRKCCLI